MTDTKKPTCIHCSRSDEHVPLLTMIYKGGEYQICSEHLPVLIHSPHKLTGKLPDADKLNAHE